MIDRQFWQGKRVLLTGHTGFKGSWLAIWLHRLGAEVIGYSLEPPSSPSLFAVGNLDQRMVSIHGDVTDLARLEQVYATHRPEIVIHMAAQALVRESYQHPVTTYATNVMGTVNVLEAARITGGVRAIVAVTSDKCYENREWHWGYRENEAMGGHDPYSSSKGCAELVAAAYRRSFFAAGESGAQLATVRAGNVIGGGDWATDRLVPDLMRSWLARQPVVIRYPAAIRPWQHVLEPLTGYLMLAEQLWQGGAPFAQGWNFGANDTDARPVAWIVEQLAALSDGRLQWKIEAAAQPHEATFLKLDCSRAKQLLGWAPVLNLSEALAWVLAWFKAYEQGADMFETTLAEIDRYEQLLIARAERTAATGKEGGDAV